MNWNIQQIQYHDSIHNREYHHFYYRDSKIFTIAQLYYVCMYVCFYVYACKACKLK